MSSYNGSIKLADDGLYATQNGLHEYVGIVKNGGAPIYLQKDPIRSASIIYKDWRSGYWAGTVMSYISSLGAPNKIRNMAK